MASEVYKRLYPQPEVLFPYEKKSKQPFVINYKLEISTLKKVWHGFLYIDHPKIAILRGSLCQSSKRFSFRTRGRQDAANCVVAIIFAKLFKMSDWNSKYIDKILITGDELLNISITKKPKLRYEMAEINDLYKNIYIDNVKITFTKESETISGKLYPECPGNFTDLKTALKEYLSTHEEVACAISTMYIAFWKKQDAFYYFDSHKRNEQGLSVRLQNGTACIMRFIDVESMVDAVCLNLDQTRNFKFTLFPINILRMVKIQVEVPEISVRLPLNVKETPECQPTLTVMKPKGEIQEESTPEPSVASDFPLNDYYEMNPEFVRISSKLALNDEQLAKLIPSQTEAQLPFEIKPVLVPSVTYFSPISSNTGILRANTFKKPEFAPAIALYSLGMLKIYKSRVWNEDIIDKILHYGHKLYKRSFYKLGNSGDRTIVLKDVIKDFEIMGRKLSADIDHSSVIGMLNSTQSNIVTLTKGISDFFKEYDTGIIQGPITVAIWQEEDKFYMFDPYERDANGLVIKPTNGDTERSTEGKACVTWYKILEDLNKTYCSNVPKERSHDPFLISSVLISDFIEVPYPWCSFVGLKPGKWILRGSFSQNSSRFIEENRNNQCTAISAIALTFRLLYPMEDWTPDIVDNILLEGDEYYTQIVDQLKKKGKFRHPHLMLDELLRSYVLCSVSGKHAGKRINFNIRECVINGVLTAQDNDESLNLKRGMEKFFEDADSGIVTTGDLSIAIWKINQMYYYFDSQSRDVRGLAYGIGTACVLRSNKIDELVTIIEANLNPKLDNLYNIGYCEMEIWESDETGGIKPPLHNYKSLNNNSAILYASHHQGLKNKYHESADKQTLSNCLVATAMMKIMPAAQWTTTVFDEILKIGNKLHERAYLRILEQNPTFEAELTIDQCEKNFRLGEYFVSIIPDSPITGHYKTRKGRNVIYDTFVEYFRKINNLDEPDFNKCGIFSSPYITVAIWSDLGLLYVFDPKERDPQGYTFDLDLWCTGPIEMGDYEEEEGENFRPVVTLLEQEEEQEQEETVPEEQSEKSSTQIAFKPPNGTAYCRWFTTLGDFCQHIVKNAPPLSLQETEFTLTPLTVNTRVLEKTNSALPEGECPGEDDITDLPYVGSWYNFYEVEYGFWIIRATHCQNDARYPDINRGNQDAAMAIAYLIFQRSIEPRNWETKIVDTVLKYGAKLHTYFLQKTKKDLLFSKLDADTIDEKLKNIIFKPKDLATEFCVGDNTYKIILTENAVQGTLASILIKKEMGEESEKEMEKTEEEEEGERELIDLKTGIERIVARGIKQFIINAKNKSFGIVKGEKMYYMFDSNCRSPSGLVTTVGVACLLRFMSLDKLISIIKTNLPVEGSNYFSIDGVEIIKEPFKKETKVGQAKSPEEPDKISALTTIVPGKSIISGTISQEDERFNRGKNIQSATCAVVALAMSFIHRTNCWTKEIINEVVINGDRLYGASVDSLGFCFNPWEETMSIRKCNKEFYLGVNKIVCEIIERAGEMGILNSKDSNTLNLRQGIEIFFANYNTHGVIECSELTVAIWKDNKFLYMFDPYPRNSFGTTFATGTACLMAFHSPQVMAEHCLTNISPERRADEFTITAIEIRVVKSRQKDPQKCKPPTVPPTIKKEEEPYLSVISEKSKKKKTCRNLKKVLQNWISVKDIDLSLLYAGFSQNSTKFSDFSRGYQTVANCVIAIVMFNINEPSCWTQDTLNSILISGDQLYKDSYLRYHPKNRQINLDMILRTFYIDKYRVELTVYKPSLVGEINDENISNGIYNFFLQERAGIFTAFDMKVAIFQKGGQYYMFDPYDRHLDGKPIKECGRAILYRFKDVNSVGSRLLSNLGAYDDTAPQFQYSIHAIQIKDIVHIE